MLVTVATFLFVAVPDVAQAERLYDQARYDDALAALGPRCEETSNGSECERIRAFVHAALGQEGAAHAAFVRLVAADPYVRLDDDVSPKLRALFTDAQRTVQLASELTLEPIEAASEHGPWMLKVRPPEGASLEKLVAHVAAPGAESFTLVTMRAEGDVWVGEARPSSGGTGAARYFLEATLAGGVILAAGSSAAPKQIGVALARGPLTPPDGSSVPPSGGPGAVAAGGLPRWALWSIAGGAAAVVAVGATLAIVLSKDPKPGKIVVGIRFSDEGGSP